MNGEFFHKQIQYFYKLPIYVQPATAGKQLLRYHLLILNLVSCAGYWLYERIGKYCVIKICLQYISSYLVTNLK